MRIWRGLVGESQRLEGLLGGAGALLGGAGALLGGAGARAGVMAGVVAVVVGVGGVNEARGQSEQSNCTLNEALTLIPSAQRALVSLQFEACADKDWAAQKHPGFGFGLGFDICYCNIKARDASVLSDCGHASQSSAFGVTENTRANARDYFGATLQYLPERTEENKDHCFVANCPDGKEPSGFNMNGETECETPATLVTVRVAALPAEGGGATILGADNGEAVLDSVVTVVATPAEGWYVDRWEGDGGACAGQVGGFGSFGAADTDEKSCSLAASAGLRVTVRFASALCVFSELPAGVQTGLVSLQVNACNAKGWGVQKHIVGGITLCHCNINAWDGRDGDPARQSCLDGSLPPHRTSEFSARGNTDANTAATFYFGATLQHLPERTEGNKDDCFVARCPGATEPSGFNTNGETECRAASGAVCGGLTPAKHFDGVACVESCAEGATLNAATNVCECDTGNSDDCLTPSEEVCSALTPPKFFDGSDCVDFATCAGLLTLNRQHNGCECRAPNVGTIHDCQPATAERCGALEAVRFFDGRACVGTCPGLSVGNTETHECECVSPNVGTVSDCRAPSVQSNCTLNEALTELPPAEHALVSLQFEACTDKGWGAQKHPGFGFGLDLDRCYCDVQVRDAVLHTLADCEHPAQTSLFSTVMNIGNLRHYFGATLQYLPERTEENKEHCFIAHCSDGEEPSGFNMNGETECRVPVYGVSASHVPANGEGGGLRVTTGAFAILADGGEGVVKGARVTFAASPAADFYVSGWSHSACAGEVGDETRPGEERVCAFAVEAGADVTVTFSRGLEVAGAAEFSARLDLEGGGTVAVLEWSAPDATGAEITLYSLQRAGRGDVDAAVCAGGSGRDSGWRTLDYGEGFAGETGVWQRVPWSATEGAGEVAADEIGAGAVQAKWSAVLGGGDSELVFVHATRAGLVSAGAEGVGNTRTGEVGEGAFFLRLAGGFLEWRKEHQVANIKRVRLFSRSGGTVFADSDYVDWGEAVAGAVSARDAEAGDEGFGVCKGYRLAAETRRGRGVWARANVFAHAPPSSPGAVLVSVLTGGEVSLSWGASGEANGSRVLGYDVLREVNGGGFATVGFAEGTVYVDAPAGMDLTLRYRVRGRNAAGAGEGSDGERAVVVSRECGEGTRLRGAVCVAEEGDFVGLSDETVCGVFGGELVPSGSPIACSGVDESGTFCLLDSRGVFPCRGLFKRARFCNFEHNRVLVNPFVCGRVCVGTARGGGCEE